MKSKPNLVDKVAGNNIWLTPDDTLDPVRRYGSIGLDPCTEAHNPVGAETFFTEKDDGLSQSWDGHGLVYVNPPYSTLTPMKPLPKGATKAQREAWRDRQTQKKRAYMEKLRDTAERLFGAKRADVSSLIVLWCMKIHQEVQRGVPLIALLPCGARYSTNYWQDHILVDELSAVCWVRGRVKFINGKTGQTGKGNNYDSKFYGFNVDVKRFGAAFKDTGAVFAVRRHRAGVLDGFI